jgi:hypothetical protein
MSFLDSILDEKTANQWIDQNTEEWHKVRLGRFTASEMYRLMIPGKREMTQKELDARPKKGKGSSTTFVDDYGKLADASLTYINEKVAEIFTGQAKTTGYAFPLVWGAEHEAEAVEYFEKQTGLETIVCGFFTYTEHAGGSPDRLIGEKAILEVKCPSDSVNMIDYLMLTDQWDVRRNYFQYWCQCQCNMLFTERELCYFVAFDPRMIKPEHRIKIVELKADPEFHEQVRTQITSGVKEKLATIQRLTI